METIKLGIFVGGKMHGSQMSSGDILWDETLEKKSIVADGEKYSLLEFESYDNEKKYLYFREVHMSRDLSEQRLLSILLDNHYVETP